MDVNNHKRRIKAAKGYCDLGFAKVDLDREKRRGFSEVVFCQGKTGQQIKEIARQILKHNQILLLTKLKKQEFAYLKRIYPRLKYNPKGKIAYLGKLKTKKNNYVCVVTAGTSDISVAEEAVVTLEVMGNRVVKLYDVGVAGLHRLTDKLEIIQKAAVVVVIAGMEGALASLISSLVRKAVVAVPTSFGYGANFAGLSALLTMLNSCSPGIGVVNIDNGFGAGYLASLINK
jgi:NCAIR mutase (PurE)-related protein